MRALTSLLRRTVATQRLLVTGAGPDRLGIVREMSSIVWEDNGNVLDSHLTRLAGELTVMMLVELPLERLLDVQFKLSQQLRGLNITSKQVEEGAVLGNCQLKISGADNVEALHRVTAYLAQAEVDLAEVKTHTESAPMGGTQLFSLRGVAMVPETANQDKLQQELLQLANELGVDIELK